jgi:DHA2 family methylenomycin A resistance protein-like MFS transporter
MGRGRVRRGGAGTRDRGVLIAVLGWRSILFVNVPLAILGTTLVCHQSEARRPVTRRGIDVIGQCLAIVALADIAATMIEAGSGSGWTNPVVLAGFGVFIVAAAGFIFVESRSRTPMLRLQLFENRIFRAATIIGWIINVASYGLDLRPEPVLSTHREIHGAPNGPRLLADDGRDPSG